jgi:hypothetical protein
MGSFASKDELKGWPEVKDKLVDDFELFEDYKQGFKEASQKRETLVNRASKLGYEDAKLGTKAHFDDIFKWPEVTQLVKEGALAPILYQELGASYNDAFDVKTGKKSPYEGLND